MNILSIFDGMSCGRLALQRGGFRVDKYFASEIDVYALKIAKKNWPENINLGDVKNWREWPINWARIDLILGGPPCQSFSFAGNQKGFKDPRGSLIYTYIDIFNHIIKLNPRVKFLFENVRMKKEHLGIISGLLRIKPVLINSALVSAQNRNRLYWTNWHFEQPKDKGITWGQVREQGVNKTSFYYTVKAMQWLGRHSRARKKLLKVHGWGDKMQMVEASHHKKYSSQRFFGVVDTPTELQAVGAIRGRRINTTTLKREDHNYEVAIKQQIEFRYDDKTNCLTTVSKDNVVIPFTLPHRVPLSSFFFRYITPLECERLQTLPDKYTEGVSNSQRYKMIGNGWTIDVITHILKALHTEIKVFNNVSYLERS